MAVCNGVYPFCPSVRRNIGCNGNEFLSPECGERIQQLRNVESKKDGELASIDRRVHGKLVAIMPYR